MHSIVLDHNIWDNQQRTAHASEFYSILNKHAIEVKYIEDITFELTPVRHYYKHLAQWRFRFALGLQGALFSLALSWYSDYWIIPFIIFLAPTLKYLAHISAIYMVIHSEKQK